MKGPKWIVFLSVLCLSIWPATLAAAATPIVTVATFDPAKAEAPENVAFDHQGNMYINMALTGEVRKFAPDGTPSTFAAFKLGTGPANLLGGLAVDGQDNVYALVASHNAAGADTQGVWRIHPDGTKDLFAALDPTGLPNQPMFDAHGNLWVSDSFLGSIFRISPSGTIEGWASDPLLQGSTTACGYPLPVGANGMAFYGANLFVANSSKGLIVRIPINADGSAGTASVFAGGCDTLLGGDGISVDTSGNLYDALNIQNKVVRVTPSGTIETLATAADGLDFPTSAVFSPRAGERTSVYITNSALLDYLSHGSPRPSLMRLDVGAVGTPLSTPVTASPEVAHTAAGLSAFFTVTFSSNANGQGFVFFGPGPNCSGLIGVATLDSGSGSTSHTILVSADEMHLGSTAVLPAATYSFEVLTLSSSGVETDNNGGRCYTVTIPST